MPTCPDSDTLADRAHGRLTVEDETRVDEHTGSCDVCRRKLADMEVATTPWDPDSHDAVRLPPGTRIGRFVLEEHLGTGGMGVVYRASDPELDRTVALKLIRRERRSRHARQRLAREAKALARLSHPNVCIVYDVGLHDDQVFVAMEYVDGANLRQWLAGRHDWRETLGVFVQAGRGLAAAHEAGIVHRDFKPANVIVGRDGRVRVLDFGLARALEPSSADSDEPGDQAPPGGDGDFHTRTGAVVGTPAYMAPEQRTGGRATDKSDQFSFCVSLYEGLYGARPPMPTGGARGSRIAAPEGSPVPSSVRNALLRGLSDDPARRFPSMDGLLGAIAVRPRSARIRVALAAAVVVAGAGAFAATRLTGADPCAAVARRLDGVWDAARRAAVERAFVAIGAPFGVPTFRTTARMLDDYAAAWTERAATACRSTDDPATVEARTACLDQQLLNLEGRAKLLEDVDRTAAARAPDVAGGLNDPSACDQPGTFTAPIPRDPAVRGRVIALRAKLDGNHALSTVGQVPTALEGARHILDEAQRVGYRALQADTLLEIAYLQQIQNEHKEAIDTYHQALEAAEESRYDAAQARAWVGLVYVYGELRRYADAEQAGRHAEAVLRPVGRHGELERAGLMQMQSLNYAAQRRWELAVPLMYQSLTITERRKGGESTQMGRTLANLGWLYDQMGKLDEAEEYTRRALELFVKIGGEDHPVATKLLNNLGAYAIRRERYEEALGILRRVLATQEKLLESDNYTISATVLNIGIALRSLERHAEALPYFERGRAIVEKRIGKANERWLLAVVGIAAAWQADGRAAAAATLLDEALAVAETAELQPGDRAQVQFGLAKALAASGRDLERARKLAETARTAYANDPNGKRALVEVEAWLANRGYR